MLFKDDNLLSEFDFGNTVSDDNASLKCLADEIYRVVQTLAEQEHPVCYRHTDNHGETLYVQIHHTKGEEEIYERSPDWIRQLLYRKEKTSISEFLLKMGIEKPKEGTSDFKDYLQLLYFFYMMRYFAFENDSFFRMFMEKTPTSELSPVEGASQGKYLWFILSNLMDDKESCERFLYQDYVYSTIISNITDKINEYISEDSFYENEERARVIEGILNGCDEVPPCEWHGSSILQVMNVVYKYQMLAYSGDMIRNLSEKERIFDFPELEFEAPQKKWGECFLKYGQIDAFLKEREVAVFCKQNNNIDRPDKALRNGPTEIVKYVFQEDKRRGSHIFVKIDEKGEVLMSGLMAAVIARAYIDLKKEKLLVSIKKHNGWDYDVGFKNALASSDGVSKSRLATDLAYRLFIIAVHSEFLNTTKGHGYWPVLFQPIYLCDYILLQRCVNYAFSGQNPNEWKARLCYLADNIP